MKVLESLNRDMYRKIKKIHIPVHYKKRSIVTSKCPYYKWNNIKKYMVIDATIRRNFQGLKDLFNDYPEFLTKRNIDIMIQAKNDIKRRKELRVVQNEYNNTNRLEDMTPRYVERYLKYKLFEHQRKGLALSLITDSYPLFMKQGTGKTLIAMANILHRHIYDKVNTILVVAPKIVTYEWEEQLTEQLQKLTCEIIMANEGFSSLKNNLRIIRKSSNKTKLRIIVTNYNLLDEAVRENILKNVDMIVLDESQRIKNMKSGTSFAALKVAKKIKYRLIMSGTPITNYNVDLYTQLNFVDYDIINKDYDTFEFAFCKLGPFGIVGNRNERLLKKLMHKNSYIVSKEEVLNLPEQIHRVMKIENANKKVYKIAAKELIIELKRKVKGKAEMKIMELDVIPKKLQKLQQICSGFIYDEDEEGKRIVEELKPSNKLEVVKTLLTENYRDEKVIIVTSYQHEVIHLQKLMKKLKLNYSVISGGSDDRKELKKFKKDPKCKVMIANGGKIARGLTLTMCRTMIFYNMTFDWEIYDQVISRIHRFTQNQTCEYIYLVTENSREEDIYKSVVIKKTDAIAYMMKK